MPRSARARNLGNLDRIGFLHAPDATLVLSNRVILRASHRVQSVFGWSIREVEGQSMRILYPGQTDYEVIGEKARRSMQSDPVYRDARFMRRKDGEVVWMEAYGAALDQHDPQELAIWSYRPVAAEHSHGHGLTAAEARIARYLVNGFTSKEMARSIGCSPRTVEVHRANMIAKVGVRNTSELVARLLPAR
ncbi:PAS domain S-box protein [Mesorhizobium tamadayense]|uniref:PAS domain S-box protein n=1 Tax=Mesorhizobium tamadayense TaxID=425306 RepID=A0A3P3FLZ7_9HYPH|nr:PAS domain S-box protein [Mesorhizobium tamadayense]